MLWSRIATFSDAWSVLPKIFYKGFLNFPLGGLFVVLIDGKFLGGFHSTKIGLKYATQKVHLCAVDLGDQKVRLRAVWMGRKIESFWSSNLGSKFRVEK